MKSSWLLSRARLRAVMCRGDGQPEDEEGDRDREYAVAERDDAVELDLGIVAVPCVPAGDRVVCASLALGHCLQVRSQGAEPSRRSITPVS